MSRLFGTDGVRGVANKELTPELALRLGRAAGHALGGRGHSVIIGRDTRRSGRMLEGALAAGLCSVGIDVRLVGHIPTPGLALYNASKAAVVAFTESARLEYRGRGVHLSAVLPSFTNTELVAGTRNRTKVVELEDADPRILAELLAAPAR